MFGLVSVLGPRLASAAGPEPAVERGDPAVVEIVVPDFRDDWLFPHLDNPRVQAFFRGRGAAHSLFDQPRRSERRPLVRAGLIRVRGVEDRSQRRAARRLARALVADVRPALEACYRDVIDRQVSAGGLDPGTETTQLELELELRADESGSVGLSAGVLGDMFGNACVVGVLEFAEQFADPGNLAWTQGLAGLDGVELEIPLWFWLQTS